jgi:hypothetical protein
MEKSDQLHSQAAVHLGKTVPSTHWTGGCVSPTASLDAAKKKSFAPVTAELTQIH